MVSLDLSADMECFDNLESLADYTHVSPDAEVDRSVDNVLRRAVDRRDVEFIGSGALEGDFAVFHIPADQLDVDPRQGDTFTDATENERVWRVQNVQFQTLQSRWRLLCKRKQ